MQAHMPLGRPQPRKIARRKLLRLLATGGLAVVAAALPRPTLASRGGGASPTRPPFAFGHRADGRILYWRAKASSAKVGPGPNLFSDLTDDLWIDASGLHLTITKRNNRWWCTEVIGEEIRYLPLGRGLGRLCARPERRSRSFYVG
jgi:hypothetical protein